MYELALAIGGAILAVVVSRYYYKRTVHKALTPYVQFSSSLFAGVDDSVRESLRITYEETPVSELHEVQFLIANTGERPIRDVIHPLSLAIPAGCSLLDASILHVSPEGRKVTISQTENSVEFVFPLLNSQEFFIANLLFHGDATLRDFEFAITVDDLPPTIQAGHLPHDLIDDATRQTDIRPIFWFVLIPAVLATAIVGLIYMQWSEVPTCFQNDFAQCPPKTWWALAFSIIGMLGAVVFLMALALFFRPVTGGYFSFRRRRRLRVPDEFRYRHAGRRKRLKLEEESKTAVEKKFEPSR